MRDAGWTETAIDTRLVVTSKTTAGWQHNERSMSENAGGLYRTFYFELALVSYQFD